RFYTLFERRSVVVRCRVPSPAGGRPLPRGCNCPVWRVVGMRFARRPRGRVLVSCRHDHNEKPVAVAETDHPIVSLLWILVPGGMEHITTGGDGVQEPGNDGTVPARHGADP